MPHLSPMLWIGAAALFWATLLIMSSLLWWTKLPKSDYLNMDKTTKNTSNWSWLQGGWD